MAKDVVESIPVHLSKSLITGGKQSPIFTLQEGLPKTSPFVPNHPRKLVEPVVSVLTLLNKVVI